MGDIIVTLIIISILSLSILKIVKEKKRGVKCIGCPHGGGSKKKNKDSIIQIK